MENLKQLSRKSAIQKVLTNYYTDAIYTVPTEFFDPDSESDIINWVNKRNVSGKYDYALVTINPKSDIFPPFEKAVNKALKKKFIKTALYNYEWRNDNVGLHVHMLITLTKPKKRSEIRREFYNTFKYLVGGELHIHVIMTNDHINMKAYIAGTKNNRPKQNKHRDMVNRLHALGPSHDSTKPMFHSNIIEEDIEEDSEDETLDSSLVSPK